MPVSFLPNQTAAPQNWAIFCAAIDNFGDIGVCWRLASQLHREYGARVHLWVDDWNALQFFLGSAALAGYSRVEHEGVSLHHWSRTQDIDASSLAVFEQVEVVLEAFACAVPDCVLQCMANRSPPPRWFNLEYLSAEDWARDCHLLASPQSVEVERGTLRLLHKQFFFPGFGDGTGGLIRESGLLDRHAGWQADLAGTRQQMLCSLGLPPGWLDTEELLLLSLFTYEGRATRSLLGALEEGGAPALCLVPCGRSLKDVAAHLGLQTLPAPGEVFERGALRLLVLPFLSQGEYDCLLSLCDCNFVRGEDSFVRAQYAGHPLVWQLYPQEDNAHLVKMEAFLRLYCGQSAADKALATFWRHWNLDEDCRELWHYLRPQLPTLQRQARNWQQKLASWPDLAASLVQACREPIAPSPTDGEPYGLAETPKLK
ncbi:MAG: elongation factor P maturation arginine rhamnosyltransferase EarP [Pseudomonadales bacterium]|nr:elongation factor P maturation arginine rhamnosyltransferase EarP [Pseudomonadales bacterium]MCP5358336.1 elongation factor P maturation arginine rhamnosyltransferase EarP [Pseudomonadales bacterium]